MKYRLLNIWKLLKLKSCSSSLHFFLRPFPVSAWNLNEACKQLDLVQDVDLLRDIFISSTFRQLLSGLYLLNKQPFFYSLDRKVCFPGFSGQNLHHLTAFHYANKSLGLNACAVHTPLHRHMISTCNGNSCTFKGLSKCNEKQECTLHCIYLMV